MLQATGMQLPIEQHLALHCRNPARDRAYEGMVGIFQRQRRLRVRDPEPYATLPQYLRQIRNTGGNFDGISIAFYFDHHDFDWTMYLTYHPSSTDFWMGKAERRPEDDGLRQHASARSWTRRSASRSSRTSSSTTSRRCTTCRTTSRPTGSPTTSVSRGSAVAAGTSPTSSSTCRARGSGTPPSGSTPARSLPRRAASRT